MTRALLPMAFAALLIVPPAMADERVFDFSGFTEVAAGSGLDVEITQGEGFSVTAEGSARALNRLEIETEGKRLVIAQQARGIERFSPLMRAFGDEVEVRVTLPELNAVTASAGSDVSAQGSAADSFSGAASSGAELTLSGIAAETVTLDASSGASLEAAGRCGTLGIDASSGADVEARDLACDAATAGASSGANIEITATTVRAEASSGANVDVWGAENIEAETSSGGEVERQE